MKTSIIGYPRIGSLRELKFASEKYFRGEISASELQETAKQLRLANLNTQRESGLDFIPSGDFSFYDGMLDTAVLLNIVPERYRNLNLSELDTYFAMARGRTTCCYNVNVSDELGNPVAALKFLGYKKNK